MNTDRIAVLCNDRATPEMYELKVIPKFRRSKGRKIKVGERQLHVPNDQLKALQSEILQWIQPARLLIHPAAHGFMPNRGIRTSAEQHVGARFVLRIDLKDFFPSIQIGQVEQSLRVSKNCTSQMLVAISRWCFYRGVLPQGAPTSPYLSNVASYRMDHRITTLCEKWRSERTDDKLRMEPITYTRYADDLIFSSDYPYLYDITRIIKKIVASCGWQVNTDKTILRRHCARQVVTGVTVNEKVSVPRPTRRALRGRLHRLIMDRVLGKIQPGHELYDDKEVPLNPKPDSDPFAPLRSLIAYYTYINEDQGSKLANQLAVAIEVHTKPEDEWNLDTQGYIHGRANCN